MASLQTPLGIVNPLSGADHQIASWFHAHLTQTFVSLLHGFSEFGASESIGIALFCLVTLFAFKRWWPSLATLVVVVPGGMLLNEWIKVLVHRHRPFVDGPFVDWSGYSFASGHTIGATLFYGQLVLFAFSVVKSRRWRSLIVVTAALFILMVGFSRIALGAHYLTDVLAAICFGMIWLAVCLLISNRFRRESVVSLPLDLVEEPVLVPVEAVTQLPLDPPA